MKRHKIPQQTQKSENNVIKNQAGLVFWLFIGLVIATTFFFNEQVIDRGLLPRFFGMALFTGLIITTFIFSTKHKLTIPLNIYFFAYTGYFLVSVASVGWGLNKGEAMFDAARVSLGFMVFVIAVYIFSNYFEEAMQWLTYISIVVSVFTFGLSMSQINSMVAQYAYEPTGIIAIFTNKNLVASILFLISLFCFHGLFSSGRFLKFFSIAAIALNIIMFYLLQTRAVWLACGITTALFFAFYFLRNLKIKLNTIPRYIATFSIITIVILSFLFILPKTVEFLLAKENVLASGEGAVNLYSGVLRLQAWEKTFRMFYDYLWLGVGGGNWQIYITNYQMVKLWEDTNMAFQRPHNDFLWVLSEKGVVGFIVYITFVVGILFSSFLAIFRQPSDKAKQNLALMLAFAIGFYLVSFFDFPLERFEHTLFLNILMAALFVVAFKNIDTEKYTTIKVSRYALIPFLAICLFCLVIFKNRYIGETGMQKVYQARADQNFDALSAESEKAFSEYYSIDQFAVPLPWFKGNVLAIKQKFAEALPVLKEACRYSPYNRYLLNDLGTSYAMLNNEEQAVYFYKQAARISPNFDDPKLNLVMIYLQQNNKEKAAYWESQIAHESQRRSIYREAIKQLK